MHFSGVRVPLPPTGMECVNEKPAMHESLRYQILKRIQDNPEITQRELARKTGFSLGKINYCLRALIDKGLVKARNFKNSRNKSAYAYKLTPQGLDEKVRVTSRFLKAKLEEYEELKTEIEALRREVESGSLISEIKHQKSEG